MLYRPHPKQIMEKQLVDSRHADKLSRYSAFGPRLMYIRVSYRVHMHESVVVTRGNYKSDFGSTTRPPNTKILSRKQFNFFALIDLCMYLS